MTPAVVAVAVAVATTLGPGPARRLLEHELDKDAYRTAHATWWDRASKAVLDWFEGLRIDGLGSAGVGRTALAFAIVVVIAVVVLVVVTRGLPRRRALAAGAGGLGVFDDDDRRSAAELRRVATDALRTGSWDDAVIEGYRALARDLAERDLVLVVPGATARTIARAAATPFPGHADRVDRSAEAFDGARYLGVPADEAAARLVVGTATELAAARPVPTGAAVPA